MTRLNAISLAGLLLASTANAQVYDPGNRGPDAYTWIQPEDTVILTQNGDSEPVYPSPRITGVGGWEGALDKARAFVGELTLEEKMFMVTGQPGPCVGNIYPIPRLNFNGLCLQDGPASLRTQDFVSVFPAGVTIASSWDKDAFYDRSVAMGREFKGKGANIALAPAVGPMGRSPFSGRNWEGFSPDPYLSGVAFALSVSGLQDAGVQATAKHFLLNEQEILRNPVRQNGSILYESVSSNADDRTVHELYLWPYADATHAGVSAIMCSYNRLNGSYGCQNSKLLNGLLKEELGFQGFVMADWYAVHSGVASIEAGLDMDMPGHISGRRDAAEDDASATFFGPNLVTAVNNGTLEEERLDDMVTRIMTPYFALGQDEDFPSVDPAGVRLNTFSPESSWRREWNLTGPVSRDVREDHGELIRRHAAESTVLLKNERNALPLNAPKRIAVFGQDAGPVVEGPLNQAQFDYGTLAVGGGSGAALFTYLIDPLQAIKAKAAEVDALVEAWMDNDIILNRDANAWSAIPLPNDPEVCLVFLKGWATEGQDRENLVADDDGNELVETVAGFCNNTVVVTHTGGITMLPFADNENVTAILVAHYPGQESGNSIVDVLYGDVNPSGHLPYTIAYKDTDYNTNLTTNINTTGIEDWQSWFDERLYTDYRYFDAFDVDVRYEFGFGLTYTTFELSGLSIEKASSNATITSRPADLPVVPGGNPALWEVLYTGEVTIQNTGDVAGAAVAQLYVSFPDSAPEGTPVRQLRGFDKVRIEAGEEGKATFELHRRDISYWNTEEQQWVIPKGEFTIHVGFSSRDLRETANITPVRACT
ncbi:hypothetical protein S7711_04398 [Stachybotrys chartarum IBT 7711]|uniref:Beta-glucosidase cel3A n=1 Tax=Stachybotrys chartarum (strain CBS 109288 / IBT 7711) TaxID=1280523 RepID=A0A084B5H8_STACB|nr:hypothetical protein S7711_04398 [Stachybotrys chartarum IBT 7711]